MHSVMYYWSTCLIFPNSPTRKFPTEGAVPQRISSVVFSGFSLLWPAITAAITNQRPSPFVPGKRVQLTRTIQRTCASIRRPLYTIATMWLYGVEGRATWLGSHRHECFPLCVVRDHYGRIDALLSPCLYSTYHSIILPANLSRMVAYHNEQQHL